MARFDDNGGRAPREPGAATAFQHAGRSFPRDRTGRVSDCRSLTLERMTRLAHVHHCIVAVALHAFATAAGAQAAAESAPSPTAAPPAPGASVEVAGVRDPDWKPYRSMLEGVKTFEEKHALAPRAALRFVLIPRRADVDMDGLVLRLGTDEEGREIPLDADKVFALPVDPALAEAGAELTANRRAGSLRWLPHVRSPDLPAGVRRLGDLRLACEVHWSIDRETLPFAMRSMIGMLGGPCGFVSSKGTYSFHEPRRLRAAVIVSGDRREAVPVSGYWYTPPLRDRSWDDDSLVELESE